MGGEPMDIVIKGPKLWQEKWLEVGYSFQTKNYLPDAEILAVSAQHPQLCFVLGCCDLNGDEYESYLIYRGEIEKFRLPDERVLLYREAETGILEDGEEYDFFSGWEPMDELIAHGDERVVQLLKLE